MRSLSRTQDHLASAVGELKTAIPNVPEERREDLTFLRTTQEREAVARADNLVDEADMLLARAQRELQKRASVEYFVWTNLVRRSRLRQLRGEIRALRFQRFPTKVEKEGPSA